MKLKLTTTATKMRTPISKFMEHDLNLHLFSQLWLNTCASKKSSERG